MDFEEEDDDGVEDFENDGVESFENKCVECGKTYSSVSNLNRHAKEKHKVENATITSKVTQKCPLCDCEFRSKKAINDHLQAEHKVELDKDRLEFESKDEFLKWKVMMEDKNECLYIKKNGAKKIKGGRRSVYYCYRSGLTHSKSVGIRRMRIQGSVRINATCPSWIKLMEDGKKLKVEFIKTHVGHCNEIVALGFTKEKKNPWKHS